MRYKYLSIMLIILLLFVGCKTEPENDSMNSTNLETSLQSEKQNKADIGLEEIDASQSFDIINLIYDQYEVIEEFNVGYITLTDKYDETIQFNGTIDYTKILTFYSGSIGLEDEIDLLIDGSLKLHDIVTPVHHYKYTIFHSNDTTNFIFDISDLNIYRDYPLLFDSFYSDTIEDLCIKVNLNERLQEETDLNLDNIFILFINRVHPFLYSSPYGNGYSMLISDGTHEYIMPLIDFEYSTDKTQYNDMANDEEVMTVSFLTGQLYNLKDLYPLMKEEMEKYLMLWERVDESTKDSLRGSE